MALRRFDVVIVDFLQGTGSEQDGRRPALVVSNDAFNALGRLVTVVPFTTSARQPYVTEVEFQAPTGGLERRSILMTPQILTISSARVERVIGHIGEPVARRRVESGLAVHLNLPGAQP